MFYFRLMGKVPIGFLKLIRDHNNDNKNYKDGFSIRVINKGIGKIASSLLVSDKYRASKNASRPDDTNKVEQK